MMDHKCPVVLKHIRNESPSLLGVLRERLLVPLVRKVSHLDLVAEDEQRDKHEGAISIQQSPQGQIHDQLEEHVRGGEQLKVASGRH